VLALGRPLPLHKPHDEDDFSCRCSLGPSQRIASRLAAEIGQEVGQCRFFEDARLEGGLFLPRSATFSSNLSTKEISSSHEIWASSPVVKSEWAPDAVGASGAWLILNI